MSTSSYHGSTFILVSPSVSRLQRKGFPVQITESPAVLQFHQQKQCETGLFLATSDYHCMLLWQYRTQFVDHPGISSTILSLSFSRLQTAQCNSETRAQCALPHLFDASGEERPYRCTMSISVVHLGDRCREESSRARNRLRGFH